MIKETIDVFKVCVAERSATPYIDDIEFGFVTDFVPTRAQRTVLRELFQPVNINTLFSVEERSTLSPRELLSKQFLHYVEVYGLGMPGLFDLEVHGGKTTVIAFVKAVTLSELTDMVHKLIYSNAPVKDSAALKTIIRGYEMPFDVNLIQNNEMRIELFDPSFNAFDNGDDAVRWMCFHATQKSLLIKSPEVIAAVKAATYPLRFFEFHAAQLAEVFNRHKPLILAAKNKQNRTIINKIARLSKNLHRPLPQHPAKSALQALIRFDDTSLKACSLRDKFKLLNLIEYKLDQHTTDAFLIRNGKIHVEQNRKLLGKGGLAWAREAILVSLADDLRSLRDKNILLDANVDYGLPISRKQTLGNLPYGTLISVDGGRISSGVYWHESDGARDLDLSAIDVNGQRTGWGMYSGYASDADIVFSGDVVSAYDGAMEFMTSKTTFNTPYGLMVNIFSGEIGSKFKLTIGSQSKDRWIENPLVSEQASLDSRQCLIGFVKGNQFCVYSGRLGNKHVSGAHPVINRALAKMWTVRSLLSELDIDFDTARQSGVDYDVDLSYAGFTFDKLEELLLND